MDTAKTRQKKKPIPSLKSISNGGGKYLELFNLRYSDRELIIIALQIAPIYSAKLSSATMVPHNNGWGRPIIIKIYERFGMRSTEINGCILEEDNSR
jgi:hypothetical protein